ncbi:MAG: phosphatidylglycerophosphatase A [candidate division NC10 bacterium]|nr:phosphatidylglycerophosphatase A [candidate division NC10 bacterium]
MVDDQRKQTLSDRLVVAIATGVYVGYLPPAPGTLGSLLGLLLLWPLKPGTVQVLVTLFLIGVGIVVADQAARVIGGQDPPAIVIDEIAGIAVATLLLPPQVPERVVAFVIFRVFDVIKPFPARQAERLPGGFGIVGDDLIAGLYTNLLVRLWLLLS